MSLCLSHVLVQIYCPLCDHLPGPSVSQRWGRSTVKPSHITVPLLITGGPRQVAAMLATRINARIWRAACLSTPLISPYTHPHTDWFHAGCQLCRRLESNMYTLSQIRGAWKGVGRGIPRTYMAKVEQQCPTIWIKISLFRKCIDIDC